MGDDETWLLPSRSSLFGGLSRGTRKQRSTPTPFSCTGRIAHLPWDHFPSQLCAVSPAWALPPGLPVDPFQLVMEPYSGENPNLSNRVLPFHPSPEATAHERERERNRERGSWISLLPILPVLPRSPRQASTGAAPAVLTLGCDSWLTTSSHLYLCSHRIVPSTHGSVVSCHCLGDT